MRFLILLTAFCASVHGVDPVTTTTSTTTETTTTTTSPTTTTTTEGSTTTTGTTTTTAPTTTTIKPAGIPPAEFLVPLNMYLNSRTGTHAYCATAACVATVRKAGFTGPASLRGYIVAANEAAKAAAEKACPGVTLQPLGFFKKRTGYQHDLHGMGLQAGFVPYTSQCGATKAMRAYNGVGDDIFYTTGPANGKSVRHEGRSVFYVWPTPTPTPTTTSPSTTTTEATTTTTSPTTTTTGSTTTNTETTSTTTTGSTSTTTTGTTTTPVPTTTTTAGIPPAEFLTNLNMYLNSGTGTHAYCATAACVSTVRKEGFTGSASLRGKIVEATDEALAAAKAACPGANFQRLGFFKKRTGWQHDISNNVGIFAGYVPYTSQCGATKAMRAYNGVGDDIFYTTGPANGKSVRHEGRSVFYVWP